MKRVFAVALLSFGLLAAVPVDARHETDAQGKSILHIVHECALVDPATGKRPEPGVNLPPPSLDCALKTFGNVAQLILGITGSVALLMFVYGGFLLLASGGSEEKITKGKEVIRNAVFGIVIIMTSGLLIRYGLSQLDVKYAGAPCRLDDGRTGEYVVTTDANGKETFTCRAIVAPPK